MKKLLTLLLAMVMVVGISSCASKSEPSASSPVESTADKKVLACLISEAPKGTPFADLTWSGFEKMQSELGVEIKMVEAMDKAEYAEQIRAMAKLGASPIYSMFDSINEVVLELAPEYPDAKFFLIDSNLTTDLPNVSNIIVDSYESSFIAGFIAAKTTKTDHIAWVGNIDIPVINRFRDGYIAGATYANPNIKVDTAYTGSDSDPVKGRETANIMIANGVDVIFQSANMSGMGVIEACSEAGIKCIGVDDWQGGINPCVFWSALKDIDGAVFKTCSDYVAGNFTAGRQEFSIKTNSEIYDQRDFDKLPAELQAELKTLEGSIRGGSIDIFSFKK